MRKKARRSFTIFDALVLVAATAVGMAGSRAVLLIGGWSEFETPTDGWSLGTILHAIPRALCVSLSLLAAWTIALMVLQLRRPRARLQQLALQPGTVDTPCLESPLPPRP